MNAHALVGNRFQRASPPHSLWQVEQVVNDLEGLPHARLVNVDSPADSRMISASTLVNRNFYKPVDNSGRVVQEREAPVTRLIRMLTCFFA